MGTSFIMFFMIGVILSIHPASIIVGEHTQLSHLSRWTRWNGYLIFILTLFIVDVLITNGIYAAFYDVYGNLSSLSELTFDPMALFFSESFQIGVVVVFALVLLQALGLVKAKTNRLGWNGTWCIQRARWVQVWLVCFICCG